MHILKQFRLIPVIFLAAAVSCKPQGPVTPGDAFREVKGLMASNPAGVYSHLSRAGREKLDQTARVLAAMNERQLAYLADYYGTTPEKMKNLGGRDFFRIYLASERNEIRKGARLAVVGIDVTGDTAVVNMENGMKILFTREGPYWRLDISDL